jgi:hypothetical protein
VRTCVIGPGHHLRKREPGLLVYVASCYHKKRREAWRRSSASPGAGGEAEICLFFHWKMSVAQAILLLNEWAKLYMSKYYEATELSEKTFPHF